MHMADLRRGTLPLLALHGPKPRRAAASRPRLARHALLAGGLHGLILAGFLLAPQRATAPASDNEPMEIVLEVASAAPVPAEDAAPDQAPAIPGPPDPILEAAEPLPPAAPPPPPAPEPEIVAEAPHPLQPVPAPPPEPEPKTAAEPARQTARPASARPAAKPAPRPSAMPAQAAASATPVPAAPAPTADDGPLLITQPHFRTPPVPPVYPRGARDQGQEGEVLVRARLDLTGNPEEVTVARSSGFDLLDRAALAAVRRWAFEPGRRGNRTVLSWVQIPVRFSLR